MLDDGLLTDGLGRTVDFRNCLIIMTSNTGSRTLADFGVGVGFNTKGSLASTAQREKDVQEDYLPSSKRRRVVKRKKKGPRNPPKDYPYRG